MIRIAGKLALVTGATAGIGQASARRLAADGADLVLWARREERLRLLAAEIGAEHGVAVHLGVVDVRRRSTVFDEAERLREAGLHPEILVNNAGLAAGLAPIQEGDPDDWDRMIDTNVKGLLYVTRAFLPNMLDRDAGHIINIGSVAGYQVYAKGNVYNATKFAVRALTEATNIDVLGSSVRVSSIDPGLVETEFSLVRFHDDEERARPVYQGYTPLAAEDVADVLSYIVNAPSHVNVADAVLLPTAQRGVHYLHREDS